MQFCAEEHACAPKLQDFLAGSAKATMPAWALIHNLVPAAGHRLLRAEALPAWRDVAARAARRDATTGAPRLAFGWSI